VKSCQIPEPFRHKKIQTKNPVVKIIEREKCRNRKSQTGTIFKFRGDIAISGSGEKSGSGKFPATKISGPKKIRPRKKLPQQFQRPRWFIPSFPVETIRQPESEASYRADAIFGSPTVALIRASPFHRVRSRFSGLIREKAGLIHIKSPLHRRKIKRPNRPKCGHNLRRDRGVICRTRKNPCFSSKFGIRQS
jgi:hypothetical protein